MIKSDNGTNFVGSVNELRSFRNSWENGILETTFAEREIFWKFNPPSAPHFGGVWERLVQSVKRAMYNILGSRKITDETLQTTFCLVEQTLNARPITYVSDDIEDLEALTPNHFLLGRPSHCLPDYCSKTTDGYSRKAYKHAQLYADQIWKRWLSEYVPNLLPRSKWNKFRNSELKTGDLVWLIEPN